MKSRFCSAGHPISPPGFGSFRNFDQSCCSGPFTVLELWAVRLPLVSIKSDGENTCVQLSAPEIASISRYVWFASIPSVGAPVVLLPVHDHPARPTVFVYLTDGGAIRFTHIQPEFTAERPRVREGGIRFHTGAKETHVVEYLGDAPSEYLRIELKTEWPEKKSQHVRMAPDDLKPFENSQ